MNKMMMIMDSKHATDDNGNDDDNNYNDDNDNDGDGDDNRQIDRSINIPSTWREMSHQ